VEAETGSNHEDKRIVNAVIEDEMRQAYLDYSMSVIVGRALPDIRDGLKPVHRRILYAMNDMGIRWNTSYKKCARIVGEVLGKYHPHGDQAVYDSLVRMAQQFSLRDPLVQGQGNFGSQDGDNQAAMRYCVTGDTLILTEKGIIPIKDISSTKKEAKISLKIKSYNGKTNKVVKFFNSGKHKIIKIETNNGFQLKSSKNHPVLCWTKNEFGIPVTEWKLLEQITTEDHIIINRKHSLFSSKNPNLKKFHPTIKKSKNINLPTKINKKIAFLLGALVAEGSFHQNKIIFNNKDLDYYNFCKNTIIKNFEGVKLYERDVKGDCKEFELYHKQAVKFLVNIGLKEVKSDKKEIPDTILKSKKEIITSFLKGLFEGDGSVIAKTDKRHSGKSIELTYNSKSGRLIFQLKTLLLNFGIITQKPYQDKRNDCYKLIISGVENISKFHKEIGFFSERKNKELSKITKINNSRMSKTDFIPFLNEYLRKNYKQSIFQKNNFDRYNKLRDNFIKIKAYLKKSDELLLTWILENNYFFNQVNSIQQINEENVYSIKVDSDCHSFVGNGFINHNTEARLSKISQEMLQDIDKETVDWMDNFDGSLKEPRVLPCKFPNLLVNGSTGIAVGMATNIPPHNLKEVSTAVIKLIENPELKDIDLLDEIKGPDFPTGGIVAGTAGIRRAYMTGRGKAVIKARMHEEEKRNHRRIIITEIPYMINKADLVIQIADCVKDKKIEGISDLRDESDRKGMRIVIELKKDASIDVVKNQLYKYTRLQDTFGIILLSLVNNAPKILGIRTMLEEYIKHRQEVVRKRTEYDLKKAKERAHILEGLVTAIDDIDNAIALIKKSTSASEAKESLMKKYSLSEIQSQAILDMKLQKLARLEHEKIKTELEELKKTILELNIILADEQKILGIIKEEQQQIIETYGTDRKTEISEAEEDDLDYEDLIPKEDVVVTMSHTGYVKRMPLDTYRVQRRGGVGVIGADSKEDDFIEKVFIANTHSYLLVFTDKGKVHWVKVYKIPESSRYSKGKAIINLVEIDKGDTISGIIPVKEFNESQFLLIATKKGIVKKTSIVAYSKPRRGGIRAITLDEGDDIISIQLTNGTQQILLGTKKGLACKFNEKDARSIGRTGKGVIGIRLKPNDEVVGMILVNDNTNVLTLTSKGYGKQTKASEYRLINRGGKGVININLTAKNGEVVTVKYVNGDEDLMLATRNGMVVRTGVKQISTIGRNTQGVRVIKLREGDSLMSAAKILSEEEAEKEVEEQEKKIQQQPKVPIVSNENVKDELLDDDEPEEEDVSPEDLIKKNVKDETEDDSDKEEFDRLKEITKLATRK